MSSETNSKSEDTEDLESADSLKVISQRLGQLVAIAEELREEIDATKATRAGWILFFKIAFFHAILIYAGLSFLDSVGYELVPIFVYGFLVGGLATLTTWHGLSLRPFGDRWLRSSLALFIVVGILSLNEDYNFTELVFSLGGWVLYGGGSAIIASRIARGVLRSGLKAPDGMSVPPKAISLASFFLLSATIAFLLATSSFAAEAIGFGEPTMLLPMSIYGAGIGGLLATAVILIKRKKVLFQRILVAGELMLAIFIFNIMMLYVVQYLDQANLADTWSWLALYKVIPVFTSFWVGLFISPVCTYMAIMANGHKLVDAEPTAAVNENPTPGFDEIQ